MRVHTHYDNLKVTRDAPIEVIRAAYKSLASKHHPDLHAGDDSAGRIMRIINASYAVLCDPNRRREHDRWIASVEAEADPPEPTQSQRSDSANGPAAPSGSESPPGRSFVLDKREWRPK